MIAKVRILAGMLAMIALIGSPFVAHTWWTKGTATTIQQSTPLLTIVIVVWAGIGAIAVIRYVCKWWDRQRGRDGSVKLTTGQRLTTVISFFTILFGIWDGRGTTDHVPSVLATVALLAVMAVAWRHESD